MPGGREEKNKSKEGTGIIRREGNSCGCGHSLSEAEKKNLGSPDGNKQKGDETEPTKTRNFKALESQNKSSEKGYKRQACPGNNRNC